MNRCYHSPNLPVALLLFLSSMTSTGIGRVIGIYSLDILKDLGISYEDDDLMLELFRAFTFIPALIIAPLYGHRPLRRTLMIFGSIFACVGLMATSLATSEALIGIFLSFCGLGHCVLLTCASVALNDLDSKHFNLIYSVAMSGMGIGLVLVPYLAQALQKSYGWNGGLLLLGGLTANIIPCAMSVKAYATPIHTDVQRRPDIAAISGRHTYHIRGVLHRMRHRGLSEKEEETDSDSEEYHHLFNAHIDLLRRSRATTGLLKRCAIRVWHSIRTSDFYVDPPFNCFFISMILVSFGYLGWHAFLVPHALQRGLSIEDTLIISISASVGAISMRILVGVLSDNRYSPLTIYLICTLLNIASTLCDVFIADLYVIIVTSFISAGTIGGRATLGTLAARERASVGRKSVVFALGLFCSGIGRLLGGFYSDTITRTLTRYDVIWWLVAGISLEVVIFLTVLTPLLFKKPYSQECGS